MPDLDDLKIIARGLRWLPAIRRARPGQPDTVADLIESCVRRHGDRVFVEFEGRTLSFAAFNRAANRVAHWAIARGFGKGDVIALMMENRPEFLGTWAGLAKAGVTTALINTHLSDESLAHVLASSACRALIVGQECLPACLALEPQVLRDLPVFVRRAAQHDGQAVDGRCEDLDAALATCPEGNPPPSTRSAMNSGDALFYIYTSGTTGLPKAARFSHGRFMAGGIYHLLSGFGADDALYCALPLYHTVGGVICVNAVLLSGARLVLRRHFSAHDFWQDVAQSGATTFQYIGEMCRYLLNQPPGPHDRDHRVRYALGNGLRPDIWEAFTARFGVPRMVEFYGATESTVSLVNLRGRPGSVGRLMPGLGAMLARYDVERDELQRDADGRCVPCQPGETGELLGTLPAGKTPMVRFEGYTSGEASEAKLAHDVRAPGDAWFRTGDLLRRDRDGYYYFVDRIGDTFRWKGENVSTEEVEQALTACPGVKMAVAYGVRIPGTDGRAGMVALSLAPGTDPAGEAFRHCVDHLPAYARPAFLRIVDSVATTATFKVRKTELQREGFDPSRLDCPLYFHDPASGGYRVLDTDAHAKILTGDIRF